MNDDTDDRLEIHVPPEILNFNDNGILTEETHEEFHGVHEPDEPYEMISDDDISLPEIMKVHFSPKSNHVNNYPPYHQDLDNDNDDFGVHEQDEPQAEVEIISDDDIQQTATSNQQQLRPPLTRNQHKNLKKRTRRYRFEVTRQIYHKFTTRNVKKILIFMNIPYVNINIVRKTLFLGLKNEQIRRMADEALHSGIFTEEHYYRIRKRLHLDKQK